MSLIRRLPLDPPTWTGADARIAAAEFEFALSEKRFEGRVWGYDPAFPMDRIAAREVEHSTPFWRREDAAAWLKRESRRLRWRLWRFRGGDYIQRLGAVWLPAPAHAPLLITVDAAGAGLLWDGHHRYALAATAGHKTVPAFVGRPA